MRYEYVAMPDEGVPAAADPTFQHLLTTYAGETNKTVGMWRAIPDDLLDYRPHEKTNTIRAILAHQILSERRFFAQFVGTEEPPAEGLLPPGEAPAVADYIDGYLGPAKARLPQLAAATADGRPVAGRAIVLRRAEAASGLGVLAASAAHLSSPNSSPVLVAPGGCPAGPGDLRAVRRRDLGRGRPDLLGRGGRTGRGRW